MSTLWHILKTMLLFLLFILIILMLMFLMGFIYVKISDLIPDQNVRYLFSIVYFAAGVSGLMFLGKKGVRFLLGKDE